MVYSLNFIAGWWLILAAFISGAAIGMGFHSEQFLGGYDSFRRRLLRLGHISLAALGMLNILFALSALPTGSGILARLPGHLLLAGAIAMPLTCFLSAWRRPPFRHLFPVPVTLLLAAVILILLAAPQWVTTGVVQ